MIVQKIHIKLRRYTHKLVNEENWSVNNTPYMSPDEHLLVNGHGQWLGVCTSGEDDKT